MGHSKAERRTDPFAQTMMTRIAGEAALAVGSHRSRIPLGERAADATRQYHRLGSRKVQRLYGERRSSGMSETCRLG